MSSETSSSASTPGKRLVMCSMRSKASVIGMLLPEGVRRMKGPSAGLSALLNLAEALGLVEIVLGYGDRGQQLDLRIWLGAVLQEGDQLVDGLGALQAGELLDRCGQAAVLHPRQGFRQGVEADERDLAGEVVRLHRLHGAEDHVVI